MSKTGLGLGTLTVALAAMSMATGFAMSGASRAVADEPLNDRFTAQWDSEGRMRRSIVESVTAPGGAALEVSVRRRLEEPWRTRVTVPLIADINEGDVVELTVWVRAESPIRSMGTGNLDLQIVRTSEPYDNIFSENIRPTDEGQYYTVRGTATANFDADDVVFGANLGYGRQVIQFGPISITRIDTPE